MRRYGRGDDQWDSIKDGLPDRPGSFCVTVHDKRFASKPSFYCYRAGITWRDVPE